MDAGIGLNFKILCVWYSIFYILGESCFETISHVLEIVDAFTLSMLLIYIFLAIIFVPVNWILTINNCVFYRESFSAEAIFT